MRTSNRDSKPRGERRNSLLAGRGAGFPTCRVVPPFRMALRPIERTRESPESYSPPQIHRNHLSAMRLSVKSRVRHRNHTHVVPFLPPSAASGAASARRWHVARRCTPTKGTKRTWRSGAEDEGTERRGPGHPPEPRTQIQPETRNPKRETTPFSPIRGLAPARTPATCFQIRAGFRSGSGLAGAGEGGTLPA